MMRMPMGIAWVLRVGVRMIPWLVLRRADSDDENWPEPASLNRFSPSSRYPPNAALNVPTTLVYKFTKAGLATLRAFLGSLRSRVHCSFTAEENKNTQTCGIYWSRESEIHGLRIDIPSAEWAFLSRVHCCLSLIRKQADIRIYGIQRIR